MKKFNMISMIVVLMTTIVFSGCAYLSSPEVQQYALDSTSLAVEVSTFKRQYANIEQLIREKQAKENIFSDVEWQKLLNVDASIDILMMKAESIIQLSPDSISISDVEMMFNIAKVGYGQAFQVISAHWMDFDPSTQIMLEALDNEATMINERIEKLKSNPTNTNVTKSLTLIAGIMGIAVKMLGVAML